MEIKEEQFCIVLSQEDVTKLAQFFSLLIDIDRKLQLKKRLITKITSILRKITETK